MKRIDWSPQKNQELVARYGFGFERVVAALAEGWMLDDRAHPNVERYAHQRQMIIELDQYAWVVPYVEDDKEMFLKTLFPSRTATRDYLGRTT